MIICLFHSCLVAAESFVFLWTEVLVLINVWAVTHWLFRLSLTCDRNSEKTTIISHIIHDSLEFSIICRNQWDISIEWQWYHTKMTISISCVSQFQGPIKKFCVSQLREYCGNHDERRRRFLLDDFEWISGTFSPTKWWALRSFCLEWVHVPAESVSLAYGCCRPVAVACKDLCTKPISVAAVTDAHCFSRIDVSSSSLI